MKKIDRTLLVVLDCCVGCHACEIACRQEHDLTHETGAKWCRVMTMKPRKVEGELHLDYFPTMCVHCDDPLCVKACPVGAIVKREDGLVLVDREKCNGCRLCVPACPYGVMSFNEVREGSGKMRFLPGTCRVWNRTELRTALPRGRPSLCHPGGTERDDRGETHGPFRQGVLCIEQMETGLLSEKRENRIPQGNGQRISFQKGGDRRH